jgi:hypothetical protein
MAATRHDEAMKSTQKRATVYFDARRHRALRVKAAVTERGLSELVNVAVRQSISEDAEDLAAFQERSDEPNLAFQAVMKNLCRRHVGVR